MFKLLILGLCVCLSAAQKPWEPVPNGKGNDWWMQKHEQLTKQTQDHKNTIKAFFIGASVTEYWLNEGRPLWDSYYAKHDAANYGIGGDSTSNVIWRIQNHELDGLNPKVVILSCGPGYNMMNRNPSPTGEETLKGLEEIVKELRAKFPSSKLIIIGHTPYNMIPSINDASKHNNLELKKLANDKDIFFFDLSSQLTDNKGNQLSQMFRDDHLHLSLQGYTVWHNTMRPLFEKLLAQ